MSVCGQNVNGTVLTPLVQVANHVDVKGGVAAARMQDAKYSQREMTLARELPQKQTKTSVSSVAPRVNDVLTQTDDIPFHYTTSKPRMK